MKKKNFFWSISVCIFGLLVLMPGLAFSADPGIDIENDWNAFTWTSNAASPSTNLNHEVMVVDYDGIADGGGSHTVTVEYPNGGPTKSLQFSYKTDANHAYYHLWDSVDPSSDPAAYSGDYVYRVTRVSDSHFNEATDNLVVDPINPPDEKPFLLIMGLL
ncbi:MAG: hypothetical protein DRG83_04000, partial [Deltaproteobacteria bacterium]